MNEIIVFTVFPVEFVFDGHVPLVGDDMAVKLSFCSAVGAWGMWLLGVHHQLGLLHCECHTGIKTSLILRSRHYVILQINMLKCHHKQKIQS